MTSRRKFIKDLTAYSVAGGFSYYSFGKDKWNERTNAGGSSKMIFRFRPYELQLKHVFTLASGSRTTTPVMLTEIVYEGITGYGEASMPPYLGESHETAGKFLGKVDLSQFKSPFLIQDILEYVDNIAPGNYAAKASIDIALHDLAGKLMNQPWFRIWGLDPEKTPNTSFTIGIDKPEVVKEKTKEASSFKILKVKLGQGNDKEMIETVRSITSVPLCVDVNQGWTDRQKALEMSHWLKENGVVFIEQPMPKDRIDDIGWLTSSSPLPIIADESLQTIADFENVKGIYSGINVKLMKCGGMRAAFTLLETAKKLGMKTMIGCMTETSCAVSAAAQLSPLTNWADLDGNLLISNDVYEGVKIKDGKVTLQDSPGIGIRKL
ncbi:MAG TPA: dipeptide epimerase [Bacteroidales bacterium]|nr:dipeptide epimerase [Bacteroidales bacterium]